MNVLLVVNPVSGGVDKEPFLAEAKSLCEYYGIQLEVFNTTGEEDESKLSELVESNPPDRVGAVGGDGTVMLAALALRGKSIPLGIIPLGSANGLASELFVPQNPMEAFKDLLLTQRIHGLDLLIVNEKYFSIHMGDVGVNANLVAAYEEDEHRGMATYAKYFVEELQSLDPFSMTIEANGETVEKEGVMVGLCNARKYGTGIPLNLQGNPLDGQFEIVVVENVDLMSLIKSGLASFDERYFDSQNSIVIQTKEATLRFQEPRKLQLDGEVIGAFAELKVRIEAGAISLLTHNQNPYLHTTTNPVA